MQKYSFNSIRIINLYVILTLLALLLWIPFPAIIHFMGASSLLYAFLFAVGVGKCWASYVAIAWIPVFCVGLVFSCCVARKYLKHIPFCIIAGLELIVTLFFILFKVVGGNNNQLVIMLLGFIVRIVCYVWMVCCVHSTQSRSNTKD